MYIVLGKNGMLGSDMCAVLYANDIEFLAYDYPEIDVMDKASLEAVIDFDTDVVINCTAYTQVDKAEEDILTCRNINALGVENIALVCKDRNATLVHISTDYVFDGTKYESYVETDLTNPMSVYGETKLEAEEFITAICNKYFILRTAWLFGKNGSNFIETMINLSDREELKVINDQRGTPTHTIDLANAIVALSKTEEYGLYNATSEGKTTWYDFAKYIFDKKELKVNVVPCATFEFPTLAKRPANSVLENQRLKEINVFDFPNWETAVDTYLERR